MDVPDGIRFDAGDDVATVTLDRPDKHNALTLAMRRFFEQLPSVIEERPDVRCVVLAAEGHSFCAGADLAEIEAAGDTLAPSNPAVGFRAVSVGHVHRRPTLPPGAR